MKDEILDLRFNSLNPEFAIRYNEIALEIRHDFHRFIDLISQENQKYLDWWVEGPSSRNTLTDPLFHYCCSCELLKELLAKSKKIDSIIVETSGQRSLVRQILADHKIAIPVDIIRQRRGKVYNLLHATFVFLLKFLQLKFKKRPLLGEGPFTLIDTFIFVNFSIKERYFPGLWQKLSAEQKCKTYFVPTFVNISKGIPKKVLAEIKRSDKNFIFKESFLKFSDVLNILGHVLRVRKFRYNKTSFRSINYQKVIREEILSFHGLLMAYEALSNYHFIKRFVQSGMKIRSSLNWFENQVVDKGWNRGMYDFSPSSKTVGHIGSYSTDNYLCSFPTILEEKNHLLPKEYALMGKGYVDLQKEFNPFLKIFFAPAFRHLHLWDSIECAPLQKDVRRLLVSLSIDQHSSFTMLKMLIALPEQKGFSIVIKPHPLTPNNILNSYKEVVSRRNFIFIDGDFGQALRESDLLFSSTSSTGLESLAYGRPVIVAGNSYGLTQNPIPQNIEKRCWKICYTEKDFIQAVDELSNGEVLKLTQEVGKRIKEDYFKALSDSDAQTLLGFN